MRAAAVQLTATQDRDRTRETADRLTREAAARGAELVVLPEKWSVYGRPEDIVAGAEPLDGPALTWARGVARELGIDLLAGPLAPRIHGGARGADTRVPTRPGGEGRP